VSIALSTDAFPQPHQGDPITLSNTKVTVNVPPDLLLLGYNANLLDNGETIPSTLSLTIAGSNTTEGTHTYPLISSSPKLSIKDPDGIRGSGDETASPLSVSSNLPDTTWHPTDATQPVFFTQTNAVIKASLNVSGTTLVDTQTCSAKNPTAFVAVAAEGTGVPVQPEGSTTTTAPTTTGSTTLPRTGGQTVLLLVIAAVMLDLGLMAIAATRRRVNYMLHHDK
jgi:hypothetical protein